MEDKLCRDCQRCKMDENSETTRHGKCGFGYYSLENEDDLIDVNIDETCLYCRPVRECCATCLNYGHDYDCQYKSGDTSGCSNYVHTGAYYDLVRSLEYLESHGKNIESAVEQAKAHVKARRIMPFIRR